MLIETVLRNNSSHEIKYKLRSYFSVKRPKLKTLPLEKNTEKRIEFKNVINKVSLVKLGYLSRLTLLDHVEINYLMLN